MKFYEALLLDGFGLIHNGIRGNRGARAGESFIQVGIWLPGNALVLIQIATTGSAPRYSIANNLRI